MTTYYVGPGGNDANNGLTWAARKLTLNGAEDIPVAAGDTVYVGAGTYREMLTCDVSGSAGNPITYIGDYTGANTDGVGGVVRITTSDDDIANSRSASIYASGKNYRTIIGFHFDCGAGDSHTVNIIGCTNWMVDKCFHIRNGLRGLQVEGESRYITISNSYFAGGSYRSIEFSHSSFVSDSNVNVNNCIIVGAGGNNARGISLTRYGGVSIKNCYFMGVTYAIYIDTSPDAGQVNTVSNCIIVGSQIALRSTSVGFLVEDYNNITGTEADRSNVDVGANSNTYMIVADSRWFFELVSGGDMLSPFDLASYSQLVNLAGTSPTSTDMRGTSAIGGTREWGALEYDPDLKIEAGSGGGGVRNVPIPVFIRRRR